MSEDRVLVGYLNSLAHQMEEMLKEAAEEERLLKAATDLPSVLRTFKEIRDANERLEVSRKKFNTFLDFFSRNIIPDMMQEQGVKTISLDDIGYRFTVSVKMNASLADKAAGMDWLRDEGHGDLIQETVNASSLSAFAKSYIEETGKDLPADLFKLSNLRYTSVTKL